MNSTYFGRRISRNRIAVLDSDGVAVTQLETDATVYPVGSSLSARYEHAAGIVLTARDARRIGLRIE